MELSKDDAPSLSRGRRVWRVVEGILVALLLAASLLVCAAAFLGLFLGIGPSYSPPTTASGWMYVIARSTSNVLTIAVICAAGLVLMAAIAVGGALRRRRAWLSLGIIASLLFGGMLAFTTIGGRDEIADLTARAAAAVGNTSAAEPRPEPEPTPTEEPLTVDEARGWMVRMIETSLMAAVGAPLDVEGALLVAETVEIAAAPCGEVGARLVAVLAFSTDDNARSLTRILAAWDEAGYAPDRGMQEDLRYSTTAPVAMLRARDATTIDGLLHLTLESACAMPAGVAGG